jgi:Polysaccharide lyase/Bacterial Ig domain
MERIHARLVPVAMVLVLVGGASTASSSAALVSSARHQAGAGKRHHHPARQVDAKAPALSFRSPVARQTATGLVSCGVRATDRGGMARVVFRLDGKRIASDHAVPFRCGTASSGRLDTRKLRNGWHTLSATAYDRAGNARRRTVRFRVRNAPTARPATHPAAPAPTAPPVVPPTAPPVTAPGTPAPQPIPAPGDPGGLFFDGSRLANFGLIQDAAPDRIQEVSDPLGSGSTVFKVTVKNSDVYPLTPTENPRAQALSPGFIKPGMEFWLRHSVMFPTDFPSSVPGWLELMSIYGPPFNGSCPVAIGVRGANLTFQRGKTYGYDNPWKTPLVKNRWIDIMIHERFGTDGWVELYIDGRPVTMSNGQTHLSMQTMDGSNNGGPNHAKFSVYFQANMFASLTMYHSALRVGATRASVGG